MPLVGLQMDDVKDLFTEMVSELGFLMFEQLNTDDKTIERVALIVESTYRRALLIYREDTPELPTWKSHLPAFDRLLDLLDQEIPRPITESDLEDLRMITRKLSLSSENSNKS